jgi:glutamate-1-semialdehyde 2,1-aminomutase
MFIQEVPNALYVLPGAAASPDSTYRELEGVDWGIVTEFWRRMHDEGILFMPGGRWFMSTAHTDADIDAALEAAERALEAVRTSARSTRDPRP